MTEEEVVEYARLRIAVAEAEEDARRTYGPHHEAQERLTAARTTLEAFQYAQLQRARETLAEAREAAQ